MNRYSLMFALLVASSFAVHPGQTGESSGGREKSAIAQPGKPGKALPKKNQNGSLTFLADDGVRLINHFLDKAGDRAGALKTVQLLFATVPHPVETHLAAAFDHNLDGLQDGLLASGYLFDSSWIPWDVPRARDDFDDDLKEKLAQQEQDDTPGLLLFRKTDLKVKENAYANGLIVVLLTEKPTEGIAYSQAATAVDMLRRTQVKGWSDSSHRPTAGELRILGPTYSGSFASLIPLVKYLHGHNPVQQVLIRSGSANGGHEATESAQKIAAELPGVKIDFGSMHHDFSDWIALSTSTLSGMGIEPDEVAILKEEESFFGHLAESYSGNDPETGPIWSIGFPRDISSLRAGYEQQGLFGASSPAEPWKRFLNMKSDPVNGGDTIRSFGGTSTIETQEAILFGISEFLKTHHIRAAIVSATNEEDRLFLTQFLHANNSDIRVVIIGSTRIFTRGSTAQFSGDLMVDDFPMLPRLHDWTAEDDDLDTGIFADEGAQGTYFAAIDLFWKPKVAGGLENWFPEYSAPDLLNKGKAIQRPAEYVVALGGDSTWAVAEAPGEVFPLAQPILEDQVKPTQTRAKSVSTSQAPIVALPVQLFEHLEPDQAKQRPPSPKPPRLEVGRHWEVLFIFLGILVLLYCAGIGYANPISRDHFASFQPSLTWEYWLFKVTFPAGVAAWAFAVLAWSVRLPPDASPDAAAWWARAHIFEVLAPSTIAFAAFIKAYVFVRRGRSVWMSLPLLPIALAVAWFIHSGSQAGDTSTVWTVSLVLNTYREMHWGSGLSLLPTMLLLIAAGLVWASQAGNGATALKGAPPLPTFPDNEKISDWRAQLIRRVGRPLPSMVEFKWLWVAWAAPTALLVWAHFRFGPYTNITTLEPRSMTSTIRGAIAIIAAVILFDVFQFLFLWDHLRQLLSALDRTPLKRSFVTIREFDWRNLWSFTGISFQSRRAINTALIDCLESLASEPEFMRKLAGPAAKVKRLRTKYNSQSLEEITSWDYVKDNYVFYRKLRFAANVLAAWEVNQNEEPIRLKPNVEAMQRAIECKCEQGRFADEVEELARLSEKLQAVERFLCLMFIGFIQVVVARLHTLLVSIASMFSLLTLSVAIYPFVPLTPLLITGGALLLLIAWAFFKVFSEMDTDPILSRIVNGDDRKLQGNFYAKFAEAMALPLLTAGSSLLPGGAGRLLELVQTVFSHGQ